MANTLHKLQLGQREAAGLFHCGRDTLRKAYHELRTGLTSRRCLRPRGRSHGRELRRPPAHLFDDLRGLVQDHLQTDPTSRPPACIVDLGVPEVAAVHRARRRHRRAVASVQTIASKLNILGFRLAPWSRAGPKKSEGDRCHLPELDRGAPAGGPFRGDPAPLLRRQGPRPDRAVLPAARPAGALGGAEPRLQAVGGVDPLRHRSCPIRRSSNFYFTASKVTSDFIVDRLDQWWQANRGRYPRIRKSARPGQRAGEPQPPQPVHLSAGAMGAEATQLTLELVYYPPYHSKYNPIERCWGCWRSTGMGSCWTAKRRCWASPPT